MNSRFAVLAASLILAASGPLVAQTGRIIGSDIQGEMNTPVRTTGVLPAGWTFDDLGRRTTMNNGGGGARQIVRSEVLDISRVDEVEFSAVLEINDTSSGNEIGDSFVAYLIIDGNVARPINLITRYDTQMRDQVLSDDELAPVAGNYIRDMSYTIPAGAETVQFTFEGINDSDSEHLIVRNVVFTRPPAPPERPGFELVTSGDDLVFTWKGEFGMLYNLRSASSLDTPAASWPIFGGHADIPATLPLTMLTISRPADEHERFFAIERFPAPAVSVFEDDFDGADPGWVTGFTDSEATVWETGTPVSVGPSAANSPPNCYATNLDAFYNLEAEIWLRSPPIDLTKAGGATLSYFEFKNIEDPDPTPPNDIYDWGTVSALDADTLEVLAVIQDNITGFVAGWSEVTHAMPAEALGKTIRLEFRFQSDDFPSSNFAGWYIDDVKVTVP